MSEHLTDRLAERIRRTARRLPDMPAATAATLRPLLARPVGAGRVAA